MPLLCSHTSQSRTLLVTFSILHILSALMGSRPLAPLQNGTMRPWSSLQVRAWLSPWQKAHCLTSSLTLIWRSKCVASLSSVRTVPSGSARDVSSKGLGYLSRGWGWTRQQVSSHKQHFTINLFIPYYKQRHGYPYCMSSTI